MKTFHALGVYGASAITALTAQNTRGVAGIFPVDPAFVASQIDVTVSDIPPDAVKTGMLANRAIVEVVAEAADRHGFTTFIVDPVMVATSGALLLEADAVEAVRSLLVPRATLLTPNGPEAAALIGRAVETPADQETAARALVDAGAAAVLIKGGDLEGEDVVDVFFDGAEMVAFVEPRIRTTRTHGSGCALSSAITAWMARGEPLREAVRLGRAFVRRGIKDAPDLGSGRGPLDLFSRE